MNVVVLCITVFAIMLLFVYFLDNKARFEKIINKRIGIKSLGNMPFNAYNKNLLVENNPKANIMRYIKDIRTNIVNSTDKNVFAFISCNHDEGKSWVANNIAISLARINKKVLLIDADLRKVSNKSQIFYTEEGEGLSNFINSMELNNKIVNLKKSKKYIKQTQIPYLHIMQNGTVTINADQLLNSKRFKELLQLFKEMYDYVIIDGTSFFVNNDCLNLSTMVDMNIIVIEKNKTKYKDILKMKEKIENNNGKILGYVLNKTNLVFGKYYGKKFKNQYGTYIESTEKNEDENNLTVNEIVSSVEESINYNNIKDFDILHKEIKENILMEDFVNDIEVNFNLKFDNIEKSARENADYLIGIMVQNNKKLNAEIDRYNEKIMQNIMNYEKSTQNILNILENIQNEINTLRNEQDIEKKKYIEKSMNEIKNNIYNEKFEAIYKKIEDLNLEREFEKLRKGINNVDYGEKIEEVNGKIENINYDKKIEEIYEKINSINYDKKIEEINRKIDNVNFDDKFEELKEIIKNSNYDKQINEISIKNDEMENKDEEEKKNSNIINLGRLFIENRKKKSNVFSIEEPISFYDLKRLATEIVMFDQIDEDADFKAIK